MDLLRNGQNIGLGSPKQYAFSEIHAATFSEIPGL